MISGANQLSWLLNESIGKNFNEFINHYRVHAFQRLCKDLGAVVIFSRLVPNYNPALLPKASAALLYVLQFSDLLRYHLYEANVDSIDLAEEAGFIQSYVAIQKARCDDNLKVNLKIDIKENEMKIAPLLLAPFIENACKYASNDDHGYNSINISLLQKDNTILFECDNSFEDVAEDRLSENRGIGLENVKRRLDLLHKDAYSLFTGSINGIWHVKLVSYYTKMHNSR